MSRRDRVGISTGRGWKERVEGFQTSFLSTSGASYSRSYDGFEVKDLAGGVGGGGGPDEPTAQRPTHPHFRSAPGNPVDKNRS